MIAWRGIFGTLVVLGGLAFSTLVGARSFPEIDASKLRIELSRSGCYGWCPSYLVSVDGSGRVKFEARPAPPYSPGEPHAAFSELEGVLVGGAHHAQINPTKVQALVEQFRDARFFRLVNEYRAPITDNPTYVVSIDTGNGSKTVIDYVGQKAGMPSSITALEDAIDEAAGTDRWIKGTPAVIPLLQAEGADFSTTVGLNLMAAAAERGDVSTMRQLRDLGAPIAGESRLIPLEVAAASNQMNSIDWLIAEGAAAKPKRLMDAFERTVQFDRDRAFERLRPHVERNGIGRDKASDLIRTAAANGNVAMVRYFLRLDPRIKGLPEDSASYDPPLFEAANGTCREDDHPHPNCNFRQVVSLLLKAGADASWSHPIYQDSVLFLVNDPVIAGMLISAGADPNFQDSDGEPIIFSISDEDVALVLIDAGARLNAVRPADKMSLRKWAEYQKWPRVIKRLDAAGR